MANGKSLNIKDSITIRFRKLADGRQSIYLDIYKKGSETAYILISILFQKHQ